MKSDRTHLEFVSSQGKQSKELDLQGLLYDQTNKIDGAK